jgi:hypothetical protein
MRPLVPPSRSTRAAFGACTALTVLVLSSTLGLSQGGCKRDAASEGANAAAASSSAAGAASTVSAQAFCAFLEVLIVDQMTKADTRGDLSVAIKKEKAKVMNSGCEKSIGATVAKDPVGWQRCAACLTSKRSLEALKLCDADCATVGYGGGAAPSASKK